MKKLLGLALFFMLPAGGAMASCAENLGFLDADQGARICELEASLPFAVGERSIGGDLIYFLAKKVTFKGDTKLKQGQAFQADGKAFASKAKAQSAVERIAKRQSCDLEDMNLAADGSVSFTLGC
jgi:hypothetical protein